MANRIAWQADQIIEQLRTAMSEGLADAAEHLLQVSQERVPLESTDLQQSGEASSDPGNLQAAVSYDGDYAVLQHELLDLQHDAGRTAKYLEGPANEETAAIQELIAERIRQALQ